MKIRIERNFNVHLILSGLILITCLLSFSGCAVKRAIPLSLFDNPERHFKNGMKLFDDGKTNEAMKKFIRAKELDPEFSPAYTGIGLVSGEKKDFENAFENMEKAKKLAKEKDQKLLSYVGMIRLYTAQKGDNWLSHAEDEFDEADTMDDKSSALHYYMGVAYREAGKFEEAFVDFGKVIQLDKGFIEKADKAWAEIQKIEMTEPETDVGKEISGIKKIDRAHIAALLIEELSLDKIFEEKNVKTLGKEDFSFSELTDCKEHKLKTDIEKVITLDIRGLEPIGKTFEPDKKLTKANLAIMIEDILAKTTDRKNLQNQFTNIPSPFSDVNSNNYAFNAIMTCTTEGIIEAENDGKFGKDDPVSGADALLILEKLKEKLR